MHNFSYSCYTDLGAQWWRHLYLTRLRHYYWSDTWYVTRGTGYSIIYWSDTWYVTTTGVTATGVTRDVTGVTSDLQGHRRQARRGVLTVTEWKSTSVHRHQFFSSTERRSLHCDWLDAWWTGNVVQTDRNTLLYCFYFFPSSLSTYWLHIKKH